MACLDKFGHRVNDLHFMTIGLEGESGGQPAEAAADHKDVQRPSYLRHNEVWFDRCAGVQGPI